MIFAISNLLFYFLSKKLHLSGFSVFCQPPVGGFALYLSLRELQHASNSYVNQTSSPLHTFCSSEWLFVYSFSVPKALNCDSAS